MSKFQENVTTAVTWLSKYWPFNSFFEWMVKDKKNENTFLVYFNIFNTSLYLTAVISPWIYIAWSSIPLVLFRTSPITLVMNLIVMVKGKTIGFGGFLITVLFMMLHQICIFACWFMIFGEIEGANGKITGLWEHFYFSVVTFTTLGYGNIVPVNFAGEAIAAIEAMMGFAVFALLIGVASAVALQPDESTSG